MKNNKKIISLVIILIFCFTITTPLYEIKTLPLVHSEGIASSWHNDSSLCVQIIHSAPRINWYDFQYNKSGTWVSRLNQKIEVDNDSEYRFIINISSDQGWVDIEFINLTAWFDNGSESTNYNETIGGNYNLKIQYENTTSTGNSSIFRNFWPTVEVEFGEQESRVVEDTLYGLENRTEARNITFPFVPNKQFRYAPGENDSWNETSRQVENSSRYGLFNNFSWNFNISIVDRDNHTSWVADEFGVYRYSEILNAQNPSIVGYPDSNFSVNDVGGSGNISIITCSNGNYSLSVDISNLTHDHKPSHTIDEKNVYVQGGDRSAFRSLSTPVYLYGGSQDGMPAYHQAETSGILKNTSNVEYKCYIPHGQLAGKYSSRIYYNLRVEE